MAIAIVRNITVKGDHLYNTGVYRLYKRVRIEKESTTFTDGGGKDKMHERLTMLASSVAMIERLE